MDKKHAEENPQKKASMIMYGKKLQEIRMKKGISRKKLGDATNRTRQYIYSIEKGLTPLSLYFTTKICACLNVNLSSFIIKD